MYIHIHIFDILLMAELNDVYGEHYQDEAKQSKNNYLLNTITNNIAHRQFSFRLFDSSDLWDQSDNLSTQVLDEINKKVQSINKQMVVCHIDKKSNQVNMLPELVVETPVEYFLVIDGDLHRAYFIYITPSEVNAY
jgi:hypothetical protein